MAADPTASLREAIREIQERVRVRYPEKAAGPGGVPLPDLMPVVHARDAAEAKVAAIGTVNPRPPGLKNHIAQGMKKLVSRALNWHVREQVEFNRATMNAVQAMLEAMSETNRSLAHLGDLMEQRHNEMRVELNGAAARLEHAIAETSGLKQEAAELKDIRLHWHQWRQDWERKLSLNEVQFLRSVADLQGAFQHRSTLMEGNFRDMLKVQHSEFRGALERANHEMQQRFWADFAKVRIEYERLIHAELRVLRQRAAAAPAVAAAAPVELDSLRFSDRFRGAPEYVSANLAFYKPYFEGRGEVLDIGCGRGEFLQFVSALGANARGIDLNEECVAICRGEGFAAEVADLFAYLHSLADASLDGIFCSQVIEHLPVERLPELFSLAAAKLARNGVMAIETPNPQCLAIFATHFYLDPTHTRPVPSSLTVFCMEEAGLGSVEVHELSPAADLLPEVKSLPEEFQKKFFGGMDYAAIGWKL